MCEYEIAIIEGLYQEKGHYKNDIIGLSTIFKNRIIYFVSEKSISDESIQELTQAGVSVERVKATGVKFYSISLNLCRKRKYRSVVFSASYIKLLLSSFLTFNFSYGLVVHFFPRSHPLLYWFSLNILGALTKGLYTYEQSVLVDLKNKNIFGCKDVLVPRVFTSDEYLTKSYSSRQVVSVVGALNDYKNLDKLFSVLRKHKFRNIEFKFCCNGLSLEAKKFLQQNINSVFVDDRYFSQQEYFDLMSKTDYVFFDYSEAYGVRCSGQVLDAVNTNTCPIFNECTSFNFYHYEYDIGLLFSDEADLERIFFEIDNGCVRKPVVSQKYMEHYCAGNQKLLFERMVSSQ